MFCDDTSPNKPHEGSHTHTHTRAQALPAASVHVGGAEHNLTFWIWVASSRVGDMMSTWVSLRGVQAAEGRGHAAVSRAVIGKRDGCGDSGSCDKARVPE